MNYFITVNINWCKEKQADLISIIHHPFAEERDLFSLQRGMLIATGIAATVLFLF